MPTEHSTPGTGATHAILKVLVFGGGEPRLKLAQVGSVSALQAVLIVAANSRQDLGAQPAARPRRVDVARRAGGLEARRLDGQLPGGARPAHGPHRGHRASLPLRHSD